MSFDTFASIYTGWMKVLSPVGSSKQTNYVQEYVAVGLKGKLQCYQWLSLII
jgi:hypothetical protein